MPRRTKFGFPHQAGAQQSAERSVLFQPTRGLHTGLPEQLLGPGYTPAAQNWLIRDGFLDARSGLSVYQAYNLGGPALGGMEVEDVEGELAAVVASATTIAFLHPSANSWSELSYQRGSTLTADNLPSGTSRQYWDAAVIYDPSIDENIAVLANDKDWCKWFTIASSQGTYSDFTWTDELGSIQAAKSVVAIANRLVFFNVTQDDTTRLPKRVMWSARGQPKNMQILSGAGFEDLVEMQGAGQRAITVEDHMLLFTADQIWMARPTQDDYAFRFFKISDRIGCPYPNTIVATPTGTFFLTRSLDPYFVRGTELVAAGDDGRGNNRVHAFLEDAITEPERAWATYNAVERRVELYFSTQNSAEGFPRQALFYDLDSDTWMPQVYDRELSYGFDFEDPGTTTTWGDLAGITWGSLAQTWGGFGIGSSNRFTTLFASTGTAYRVLNEQYTDDGTAILARFRSHPLQVAPNTQEHVSEIWIDYAPADISSSITVNIVSDPNSTSSEARAATLPNDASSVFVPIWHTGRAPVVELIYEATARPRIGFIEARLKAAGRWRGA